MSGAAGIDDVADELETMIVSALLMKRRAIGRQQAVVNRKTGARREFAARGRFCAVPAAFPRDCLTCDARDGGRLFANSVEDIVVDPVKAIGSGLEILMLCPDGLATCSRIWR